MFVSDFYCYVMLSYPKTGQHMHRTSIVFIIARAIDIHGKYM